MWCRGELPGFPSCLIYPGLGTKEVSSWRYQWAQTKKKKKKHKSWLSLTIGPGMGKCSKTENLQSITSLLQPKTVGKKLWSSPPPTTVSTEWRAWTSTLTSLWWDARLPCQNDAREGQVGGKDSPHHPEVARPLPPVVSVEASWRAVGGAPTSPRQ